MRRDYTLAMLLVVTAALASACAGALAGSSAQNACPPAIDAPALYPGDTWTFRYEDGRRWRQAYDSRTEDGLLRGPGAKAQANYFYDQTHTLRKVVNQGMELTTANRDFPQIGNQEIVFPLTVGKTWTVSWYTEELIIIRKEFQVVGCEEVTVPAGTFLAVRIEVTDVFTHTPGFASRKYTLWYAPAVKYWVKRASGWTTNWKAITGYELQSFTIDTGKPATSPTAISSLGQPSATSPVPAPALAHIWERGYGWRYRWSSPRGSGTFVWEVARDELTSDVPQYIVKTGTREIVYRKADFAWLMERVDGAVETRATPANMWLTWPLAVGKEWEQKFTWENPRQRATEERTRRYRVEAVEAVTVPAGTFQAFHVTSKDPTGRLTAEYWYSPEAKWLVKERTVFSYGVRERELLEYRLTVTGAPAP